MYNTRKKLTLQVFLIACLSSVGIFGYTPAFSQYIGQYQNGLAIPSQIAVKAQNLTLQDVKLLDSRFKQNMERDAKWTLNISNACLLHTLRLNAGIASGAKPLGGWEAPYCELR